MSIIIASSSLVQRASNLQGASIVDAVVGPGVASGNYQLLNTGLERKFEGGVGTTNLGDFLTSASLEARLTLNSGTSPSGDATGTWLVLTTSRTWSWSLGFDGNVIANLTIDIRNAVGTIIDTQTVTVNLSKEP